MDHNKLENSSRDGNTLPASCKICVQVKKQQLELVMEQRTGSKLEKEYVKAVHCHPAYLNYAEYIMWKAQAGIKIVGKNINNLKYADDTSLMAESKEELESLDDSERGEWKSWFKTQHSKN